MADLGISPRNQRPSPSGRRVVFSRVEQLGCKSAQLNCWSLIYLKPVTRLFSTATLRLLPYVVDVRLSRNGGGLQPGGGKFNTYHVLSFCTKLARERNISQLKVTVIKSHYKHAALVKYYERYGFQLSKDRDQFIDLILPLASARNSTS